MSTFGSSVLVHEMTTETQQKMVLILQGNTFECVHQVRTILAAGLSLITRIRDITTVPVW